MSWRLAESLRHLRRQVDAEAPRRSKVSDGSIGDLAHQKAGTSDHLPDKQGVVRAVDITHDPGGGFDSYAFADRLRISQDPRLKYVISAGRIASGPAGPQPGVWRKYTGINAHAHHVHVSVMPGPIGDVTADWAAAVGKTSSGPIDRPDSTEDDMTPDQQRVLQETANGVNALIGVAARPLEVEARLSAKLDVLTALVAADKGLDEQTLRAIVDDAVDRSLDERITGATVHLGVNQP